MPDTVIVAVDGSEFSDYALHYNHFRNTIRVSNSLDFDYGRRSVGPDLDPNCLQRIPAGDKVCHEQGKKALSIPVWRKAKHSNLPHEIYAETIHQPGNLVIVVHCTEYKFISYPAVSVMSGDTTMSSVTREIKEEEERSVALEQKIKLDLEKLKIEGEVQRLHGEPGHTIVHLANEKEADFIVVGCRGKGKMRRTFTGSVTDFIVHHALMPVIVARHKDHIKHHHHHHHHGFHINPFHQSHHHHKHGSGTPPSQRKH